MQKINLNPDKKELRNFGLITGALTPVFFGLLLPWIFGHAFPKWPQLSKAIWEKNVQISRAGAARKTLE